KPFLDAAQGGVTATIADYAQKSSGGVILRTSELAALSWKEAEAAFKETDTAILPLGAVESHGPHNPLGTDWMAAWEVSRRVAEQAKVLMCPVMPYGWAPGMKEFPGTISIGHDTLLHVVDDVVR